MSPIMLRGTGISHTRSVNILLELDVCCNVLEAAYMRRLELKYQNGAEYRWLTYYFCSSHLNRGWNGMQKTGVGEEGLVEGKNQDL